MFLTSIDDKIQIYTAEASIKNSTPVLTVDPPEVLPISRFKWIPFPRINIVHLSFFITPIQKNPISCNVHFSSLLPFFKQRWTAIKNQTFCYIRWVNSIEFLVELVEHFDFPLPKSWNCHKWTRSITEYVTRWIRSLGYENIGM